MAPTKEIIAAIALTAVIHCSPAQAETLCSEGRTRAGECVNPMLAHVMRHDAIIRTQPRISFTAPLNLPSEDRFYPAARDHHQEGEFFGLAQRPGRIVP